MEDYVLNTFKALKSKVSGFDKTEQQFRDLVTNDPAYRANVHKALTEKVDGFSRTSEEFDSLVGVKKKDISGSGDPALQSFEGQTPSQSTVSGEINVGDVPQVPVSKTPQVPGTGETKEGVLAQPPKPKSPEELNLEMQSKVLGKDIPKDLVETAKITTDKSQLYNEAYALLKNNKTAAANAVSDIILQKFPDDSYAHQIKAHNFEVEKDYVNSAKELTQAIEKSPDDKSLYAKRALVARSAGMETTAREDAQTYLRLAKLPNGDEEEALTRSNMYMLAGDEKQAQYWKKNYEGLVQDRQRGNTAQNLIGLHDWVLSGIDKISKPLQIPGDMIVEGVGKMVEGESVPKRISGLIDAGFGVLMATPAGVVFNSAITAGELVGAGEVTEWAFAPISKALNLAGIDEKQVGSILKAGLSPTAPISEKTANAWGDLAVQIGNLLPFMLFSHGTKYAKTADKLTKREPLDATDLKNVDEVIASSAENPQSMNEPVKLAEQFIKDKKDEKEVSEVQKSMGAIPTYRIGSKLYPTPESFLKRLQDIKDKGVENINYEINLDPETSGKALDIFKEKNTPADAAPAEQPPVAPNQSPTLTEPTANVEKSSGIGEPTPVIERVEPIWMMTKGEFEERTANGEDLTGWSESKEKVQSDELLRQSNELEKENTKESKEMARQLEVASQIIADQYYEKNNHELAVREAIKNGEPVPENVLADYQELPVNEKTVQNLNPQPSEGKSENVNPVIPNENGKETSKTGRKEVLSEQPQEDTAGARSNPAVFTTQNGISIHNDKGLLVMFDKSGKEIPQVDRTVKKEIIVNGKKKITTTKFYNKQYREAKKEYLNGIEFDNGKEIDYFPDISESETDRFVLENTENPQHVLGVYERASMQNQAEKFGSMEWHIAEHLRFVTKESFDRWMSQNAYKDREDGLIQKVYFRSPKGKEQTQTLDQVAQSASAGFHGSVDNVERITPEMVGQFIIDYPGGTDKYYSAKSEIMTSAERKFTELTGLKIDKDLLQIAKNKLEAKRERNEWEKKHLRNVSPELRKTLDDPITLESLPLYREIFNKEEYKLIEEALKNEKINQGTEERPGGEESSQPIAMGETSNSGILEQERQARLAEIDSEIKRLNVEKKNESDRIDKANANIELPLDVAKDNELFNVEQQPVIADLSEYDSKIRALENERNTLISKEKQVAEADKAQGDLLKPTPDTVQSLQEDLATKRITLPEYQKRIEQVRKDMPMSIKDRADELAARIKKSKDSLDGITMMAILPYQKQIMRLGIDAAAEAVRLGGTIAEAVQKGIVKIRELCREKSLSVEEENKLIKKFENLPHWGELDSKKVQKDIDETVGVRNKLKKEYRDLKDKLFQAENRLRGKTKTEAFEKGASSRDKEVSKLKNKEGKERAELETMDDVRKNISDIVESNKEVIRKLTGQKTGTLIRKINNATTYRDLEKVINYIEKVTTDIEFRETANDIASLQKEISSLIKKNEYSKGVGKGYLGWAKEIANIPKAKLADLSGQMLNDLKNIAEELSRNKVSNVENVQKFFDDYRNEMDKIFAESNIEKVVSSESMSGLIGNVEKLTKIDPLAINTIEDIIQLKRNLSLIKNKIDRLMVQEDISYRDGKFYDKDGNVIDKYSDLAKSYDDASVGSTVQGLFTKLNDVGIKDLSESLLETAEQNARKQWIDNSNENWKHIDWDNFTPEQKEVIEWLKSNVRDKSIDELSLGELDTYAKVVEQLTYGNLPRKLIEVASSIDVLKKASIIDTDFINIIRASSEKEKYIKKHLYGENNKGKLFKDISWKKDMTDIDEKYGIANKHRHPVFEIFNDALLKPIEFLNKDRDVLFHIALGKSPFVSGKFKSVTKQRLADREVNALRVMLAWQANIPDAKVEKIMKNTGLSREQVLSYWEISESEWGKRYVADAKNSKGYDAETIKLDREAYQNIKKRNGGNLILFDLAKEDQQILEDVSRLLSKDQYQFLTDLYEGYESQKHKMKVNAVKRNIPFSELRFYDPFFIFDKPVDDAGNAQQFIDAALLDRTAPHTKSGNVNERTFDYHISKMGATDKFRQYTLTNLLNYYMADPLYHTVRALNTLKNKTEKTLTPGESEKSYLTTDEVQIVSELAEGLRTRFTNVYATKVNRGVGSRILLKAVGTMAKMGRVSLLDPTRLIKDTAGNQLTALGQLPVSQWGGYMDKIIKLNPQENKTLDILHSETGFREAERYYSEYSDSNEATKKGLYVLSFNDRATQKRIFLNEFEHAFHEFSGSEFNADRWLTESEYKSANMDAFTKASAEAKWMAYDTFPSMEKIVKKRQGEGAGTIMLNFMQTWQIRESLRFLKQAKNFILNTNEGRAEASKKIGLFLTSQTAFATIGVAQAAGLTWLASQAVSLWDEETAEKLKANSKKTIERITSPSFWATQGVSGVVQLTMGSFANLNRAAQITGLMIVNSAYPANKKPDWLKNLNDYAQAVFYVKPIETNGYTDASRNMDAILQYSMAAQSMLQMSKASGLSLYEISKKVMAGESLSKSEYDAWNLARGAHLILATMYGYPGAGTVDKLMTRVSNANRKKKSSSRPSVHR